MLQGVLVLTVAYFSIGTPYEAEAELLRSSLDRVGMAHEIVGVADRGGWYANTAHKANFLRKRRIAHQGPLLYVDVDAFVHQNCERYFEDLQTRGYDFGAHWFRGPSKGHDRTKVQAEGHRMLSGTLFLGDTPGCQKLLDLWCNLNALFRRYGAVQGGGQKNLWYLTTCLKDLRIAKLPGRYCYVFDKPWAYDPHEPRIIEHTIGSRQHRPQAGEPDAICTRENPKRCQRITELAGRVV